MSTFVKSTVLVVFIGFGAGAASAATVSGTIEHVYPRHNTIMLNDHLFRMSTRAFDSARMRRGEAVRVTYHWRHGHRWATEIRSV
ncbi:hypothetical protein [Sinorhizobium terangae]|uniref:hypothetical protein n=1 Tax=Sinorhizobium terangae TaxID=110322 RepID=UPI0024B1D900|nr:hypothetical protein [Sinorhizobium terangae]WFU48848.1 hypothetical protein QA637_05390 [Sinorhizobium terangae]